MLTAVVVLPSAPVALETRMTRGEMARESSSAVRSVRYASAGGGTEPLPRSSGGDDGSAAGLAGPVPAPVPVLPVSGPPSLSAPPKNGLRSAHQASKVGATARVAKPPGPRV